MRLFREQIERICSRVPGGDVSAEVLSTDWEGMLREGRELATGAPDGVVKVPCTGDGMAVVRDLVAIVRNYAFATDVLASSLRTPNHVIEAAVAGADTATLPPTVFHQLYRHPLTDAGMERFLADWRTLPGYEEAIFPRSTEPTRAPATANR
jgi:transaldolase